MTPQELKNSILQLAIQGKLVEQREEEGNAEDLYAQIQAEKQRLIAEKNIKKQKPLPVITDEEKPFDIPESWKWVRLGDILLKLTDGAHSTPKYTDNGIPFLSVKDMSSGMLNFSNCKYISEEEHKELYSRCNPEYGDLLLTKVGTTGIPVLVDTDIQFSLFVSVALLKFDQLVIYNKYLKYLISSPLVQLQAIENTKGVGNKNWVMRDIANTVIVLPPFAEQKRIVAKIEDLLPHIDRYEQAWSKLEQFNARFPEDMKKSLLQYAIQGKLVEQRPEEGNAEELYAQIQAEKQRLITEKKIKKQKPLPEITDDEKPFDIPKNWKWVRLGEVTEVITSGSRDWAKYYSDKGDIFLRMGNLSKNSFELRLDKIQHVCLPEDIEGKRTALKAGDLLFSITGDIGMLGLIPNNFGCAYINQHTAMLRFVFQERNKFIPYLLLTDYAKRFYNGNQHGIKNSFRLDTIALLPVPLPPLAEQKRIVEKLERLLPLCEGLQ